HTGYINQRTPDDYRVKHREEDRSISRDPSYEQQFVNFPLQTRDLTLTLTDQDWDDVQRLIRRGQGADEVDAIRSAVMTWQAR
ncbi:hypothetical protein, partial [Burkholderia sp. SIMBA_024]|uniref:hypothetical protein n=1 Tax=Burkholderia sp. SIMBA_024 TaxID=3085768 RepID=UPI00397956AD